MADSLCSMMVDDDGIALLDRVAVVLTAGSIPMPMDCNSYLESIHHSWCVT